MKQEEQTNGGIALEALRHAVPGVDAADELIATLQELVEAHHTEERPPQVPTHEQMRAMAQAALDTIRRGEDPHEEFETTAADAYRSQPAALVNAAWVLTLQLAIDERALLRHENRDGQIRYLDNHVRAVIARARAASQEGDAEQVAAARSDYLAARAAYVRLISEQTAMRPAYGPHPYRLGWLRNLDAWEFEHARAIDPSIALNRRRDPWGDTDSSRFDWLIVTPEAEPWAPTLKQIEEKHSELLVEIYPDQETHVLKVDRTPAPEPEPKLPAAARRLAVNQ